MYAKRRSGTRSREGRGRLPAAHRHNRADSRMTGHRQTEPLFSMSLTIVGAGLGRTGTTSLQEALGIVLNGPVVHMGEVFANLDGVSIGHAAVDGTPTDWNTLLA